MNQTRALTRSGAFSQAAIAHRLTPRGALNNYRSPDALCAVCSFALSDWMRSTQRCGNGPLRTCSYCTRTARDIRLRGVVCGVLSGATGEIEDGRLRLAQVHQGDRRHTLSTSLACQGERARSAAQRRLRDAQQWNYVRS
jgi:hypothetical protein